MRTIGPAGLDARVGDWITLYQHAGAGVYNRFVGRLAEGKNQDDGEFCIKAAYLFRLSFRFKNQITIPIIHGDMLNHQNKNYLFIDESD